MSPVARIRLPPLASSARAARQFVNETLAGDAPALDLVVLLVSELASNAIQHARTDFEVTVAQHDTTIRVEVADGERRLPVLRQYVAESVMGRGLHMVAASADRWGFEAREAGKVVWFEMRLTAG